MADLDLDTILARADAADPAPWIVVFPFVKAANGEGDEVADFGWTVDTGEAHAQLVRNAEFVAAARTDVPNLVNEVRQLRAALKASKPGQTGDSDTDRGRP